MVRGASVNDPKAGLTLTDDLTRMNIAKGTVSPTFFDRSGKEHYRGVVQADIVMGNDLSYLNGNYTSPNSRYRSSHTTAANAGTMYIYTGQKVNNGKTNVRNKIGLLGVGLIAFVAFLLIERR